MNKHIIDYKKCLYEALKQMNDNGVKFLVAVDKNQRVHGTLTDGDVRRSILRGMKLEESIQNAICSDYTSVSSGAGLSQVLAAFQDPRIEFLPVLSSENELVNIITRRQLNVLLLKNGEFRIDFDFASLDENELEHEIFARPWGFYKTTILNQMFQSKVIDVYKRQLLYRAREKLVKLLQNVWKNERISDFCK